MKYVNVQQPNSSRLPTCLFEILKSRRTACMISSQRFISKHFAKEDNKAKELLLLLQQKEKKKI